MKTTDEYSSVTIDGVHITYTLHKGEPRVRGVDIEHSNPGQDPRVEIHTMEGSEEDMKELSSWMPQERLEEWLLQQELESLPSVWDERH